MTASLHSVHVVAIGFSAMWIGAMVLWSDWWTPDGDTEEARDIRLIRNVGLAVLVVVQLATIGVWWVRFAGSGKDAPLFWSFWIVIWALHLVAWGVFLHDTPRGWAVAGKVAICSVVLVGLAQLGGTP